jgi:acetyl esterase/lipase
MKLTLIVASMAAVIGLQVRDKKNPPFEEVIRRRVVFSVPGMEAVKTSRDLVYKRTDGQPLHMDLYAPPGPLRPRPAVILIHGGPIPRIGMKNIGQFVSYGQLLAASGFVAVTFDHRFLAPGRLPDAGGDVTDLVAYVRKNADSLGIDPERLVLWAFSGGGPFLAAALRERPAWLRGVVAYYAVLDLQQPPAGADDGISTEVRQSYSAIRGLGDDARSVAPLIVARAGLDNAWLNGGIDRFVQAAVAKGATLDLLNHPDGRHGFDILDDDARSKEIVRRTLDFVRDRLVP